MAFWSDARTVRLRANGFQGVRTRPAEVAELGASVHPGRRPGPTSGNGSCRRLSDANLVAGDTQPGYLDVFVHDRETGATDARERVQRGQRGQRRELRPKHQRVTVDTWRSSQWPRTWWRATRTITRTVRHDGEGGPAASAPDDTKDASDEPGSFTARTAPRWHYIGHQLVRRRAPMKLLTSSSRLDRALGGSSGRAQHSREPRRMPAASWGLSHTPRTLHQATRTITSTCSSTTGPPA